MFAGTRRAAALDALDAPNAETTARERAQLARFKRGVFSCDAAAFAAAGAVPAPTRGGNDTQREASDGPEGHAVQSAFATDALPAQPLRRAARGCCCIGEEVGTSAGPCGFGQHFWALSRFSIVHRSGSAAGTDAAREVVLVADMRHAVCISARATRAARGAASCGANGFEGGLDGAAAKGELIILFDSMYRYISCTSCSQF